MTVADNVAVTPGTGATIATDDVGGVQYQRVKICVGTDGAAADVTPATATTMTASVAGAQAIPVANIGNWSEISAPAANTQATVSRAAGATGVRHVCTGISAALVATATAPTAVQLTIHLRNGPATSGTPLWSEVISLPATAGATSAVNLTGLSLIGSAATAMTLEFNAAGGANTVESVTVMGYDIS
jgi:hypothetical protein